MAALARLERPDGLPLRDGSILDLDLGVVTHRDGRTVHLSRRERELVRYLVAADRDVDRHELMREVWGHAPRAISRTLDTTVARVRRKIEPDPAAPVHLVTLHATGYRWVGSPAPQRGTRLRLPDREVDLESGEVRCDDGSLHRLTSAERRIVARLARRLGRDVPADDLHDELRNRGSARRAIARAIYRLRRKLERDAARPVVLRTTRDLGYRLHAEPTAERAQRSDAMLWSIARHVGQALGYEDCVIYLREGDRLRRAAAYGPKSPREGEFVQPLELAVGTGIVGSAALARRAELVTDTRFDRRYVPDAYGGRSELAVPIDDGREVLGVIDSESAKVGGFGERDRKVFESLAAIACEGLRLVRAR